MGRPLLLAVGLIALAAVWLGPLPHLARHAFAAHMTMHMGVVAVAAPLLALGMAGAWFDPARTAPALFSPIPASILELIVVWGWHAPGLHHFARHTVQGLILEQGSFLLVGLFMWLSAFGGRPAWRRQQRVASVAGLLLTAMHMTLLGALLALTPRPLYTHARELLWVTPLQDQHLGGAIMLIVGSVSYLLGGLWLTRQLLRSTTLEPEETI